MKRLPEKDQSVVKWVEAEAKVRRRIRKHVGKQAGEPLTAEDLEEWQKELKRRKEEW